MTIKNKDPHRRVIYVIDEINIVLSKEQSNNIAWVSQEIQDTKED